VSLSDEGSLLRLVAGLRFEPAPGGLLVGGSVMGDALRTAASGDAASQVAVHPRLRDALVQIQRSLARSGGLVMEGRDVGTVVFPDADLKIFIVASPAARARRRQEELAARGEPADLAAIEAGILERDRRDSERAASPLQPAPDAIPLDTTDLTPEAQIDLVAHWADLARRAPPMRFLYTLAHESITLFARTVLDFHVTGLPRVPRKGPLLVAANHISFWDPPLIGATLPREAHYIAKEALFQNRLFGALISRYNAIPIRRGPQARVALRGAEDVLGSGGAVVIFPEGTRNRSGQLLPPRPGIARLAAHGRAPVLPAYISGSNQIRRSMLRKVPIRISFGSPMMPPVGGASRETDRAYAQRVMEAIVALRTEQEKTAWK
jgi:cytidylate kinase